MGKPTGFKEYPRQTEKYREVSVRVKDYGEIFTGTHDIEHLKTQGARCMIVAYPSASRITVVLSVTSSRN
jgi:glutamate synthase (NADPH/NADH) small chain